jgi:hypothetical protein
MRLFMAAYFCAGVGYVISATFIVAIVDRLPGLVGHGTLIFLALGIGAARPASSGILIARRTGELNALILAAVLQIVGILLPVSRRPVRRLPAPCSLAAPSSAWSAWC